MAGYPRAILAETPRFVQINLATVVWGWSRQLHIQFNAEQPAVELVLLVRDRGTRSARGPS